MNRKRKESVRLQIEDSSLMMDSELVPSSLAEIAPILRAANYIQEENPRVAYLCRFHAFEKAHSMDPTSGRRGARQFKTKLLHRLEKEEEETIRQLARNDPREIQLYYQIFCENYINKVAHTKKLDEMAKIWQIATILYDVVKTVVPSAKIEDKTQKYAEDIWSKREQFEQYNILPLNATCAKSAIMELPEIKAALYALRNVQKLPRCRVHSTPKGPGALPDERDKPVVDILDWLSQIFGFQKANVANQREHLILLLANMDVRNKNIENYTLMSSGSVAKLMDKIFKNYWSWCNYLRCESNTRICLGSDTQQLQLIYIGLFLLVWGEASNIRFMPECICYIFHNMANAVYKILFSDKDTDQIGVRDEESFLHDVIIPIYEVLRKEARRNKGGKASHSKWRNYDDLNEYFWSEKCFGLKWPMDLEADFFVHSDQILRANEMGSQVPTGKRKPKTNFVEARTFWHLYRSFDRMWIFFIMAFQAMLIVAWSPSGSLAALFDEDVFRSVLSIFITQAFLNFLQAALDIILSYNAWRSFTFSAILWYLLKLAVATVWMVVLLISYASSMQNPTRLVKIFSNWAGGWLNWSFYNYAVAIYLVPNLLAFIIFFVPSLGRTMERLNWRIITLLTWWAQPKLYVGRGMHENMFSLLKYTLFWTILLISKLAFSYYVEILPLVRPTKLIMEMHVDKYPWHEVFPNVTHNVGVVIAIWTPTILVYFMDAQIWYAIFSALFGVIHGGLSHLGEIRTLGMLRSRFEAIRSALCDCLVPSSKADKKKDMAKVNVSLDEPIHQKNLANFSKVWNKFIESMRTEDLLSNKERDLLLVQCFAVEESVIECPAFLLASKIPIAIDMAKGFKGNKDAELFKKIKIDAYMHSAIIECYEILRQILCGLLEDEADRKVVTQICDEVDVSIQRQRFLSEFRMSGLLSLNYKLKEFLKFLLSTNLSDELCKSQLIILLQDIMEIITQDIMVNGSVILESAHLNSQHTEFDKKSQTFAKINIHVTENKSWIEKVGRLFFLLTVESPINMPRNLDAHRRITFFVNSLFMDMPRAPKVRDMLSFSVLTPYYKEDVLYSVEELSKENVDGISILFYLKTIYPDEWANFQHRINDPKLNYPEETKMEFTRQWGSYRGQTLSRTVRGMMYYKQALELQCFLEIAGDREIPGGYKTLESSGDDEKAFAQALADMKFTYVVSCQIYGAMKTSDDPRDQSCYNNILNLMVTYPSLRVAYIDEREEIVNGKFQKLYYSVLLKGSSKLAQEIYRIKLPGPPTVIGEGKAENQNHAIIFTRGEALQTIDMNQDNYFEEAFKMRNVLEEFLDSSGQQKPTILGLREHIFTGSVSSLASFTSNQETSFLTIGQRTLANLLRVRFHYGHPDIFDRIFHITRGGISKASKIINLSQDIFAGFNSTLRGGNIVHREYIQVGKGRGAGMNQISLFEAKVANGNGEQTLSRDVYRLGHSFDFYRMLSFYFSTVGFYFSSMVTVLTIYVFLYGHIYLVMSGAERYILGITTIHQSKALEEALAVQSVNQLGLLSMLPMVLEIGLEKGFRAAFCDFIIMQLQLASVFFTFQLGTKAHHYGRTILHGGSNYQATGLGFVSVHAKFSENYRLYSRSHFVKALELVILLVLYELYGESYRNSNLYSFIIFSMWFLVGSWLYAPFLFNPSGFVMRKTIDDWTDWKMWMGNPGGIGTQIDESWESWWNAEQEHLRGTTIRGRILEIILVFRNFIYQYGIVYHLDIAKHSKTLLVYGISWIVPVSVLLVLKMMSICRRILINFPLIVMSLKAFITLYLAVGMAVLFVNFGLTVSDLIACFLAFIPTGWALILIAQVCRPLFKALGLWESIKELAQAYDYAMGLVIFAPIALLSWFPIVSKLQTRLLFK